MFEQMVLLHGGSHVRPESRNTESFLLQIDVGINVHGHRNAMNVTNARCVLFVLLVLFLRINVSIVTSA